MGLFSSSSDSQQHPPQESVLKKSARQVCWSSRDIYFGCLDRAGVLDPRKEKNGDKEKARQACATEEDAFNRDCIASWVDYFKQKRVNEWERDQRIKQLEKEGATALGTNIRFK